MDGFAAHSFKFGVDFWPILHLAGAETSVDILHAECEDVDFWQSAETSYVLPCVRRLKRLRANPRNLNPQPSTLTLNPQPSQPSTLNPQPSTLIPEPPTPTDGRRGRQRRGVEDCWGGSQVSSSLLLSSLELSDAQVDEPYIRALLGTIAGAGSGEGSKIAGEDPKFVEAVERDILDQRCACLLLYYSPA